jgi:hypothetical protein
MCMQTAAKLGQRLFATNDANKRTEKCMVVFADTHLARGIAVALDFPIAMARFRHNFEIGKFSGLRDRILALEMVSFPHALSAGV